MWKVEKCGKYLGCCFPKRRTNSIMYPAQSVLNLCSSFLNDSEGIWESWSASGPPLWIFIVAVSQCAACRSCVRGICGFDYAKAVWNWVLTALLINRTAHCSVFQSFFFFHVYVCNYFLNEHSGKRGHVKCYPGKIVMDKIFRASHCILALGKGVPKGKTEKVMQVTPQTGVTPCQLCQLCINSSGRLSLGWARRAPLELQLFTQISQDSCWSIVPISRSILGPKIVHSNKLQIMPIELTSGLHLDDRGLKHAAFGTSYPLKCHVSNHCTLKAQGKITVTKCSGCTFYLEGQSHWGVIKPWHKDICASRHFSSEVFLKQ